MSQALDTNLLKSTHGFDALSHRRSILAKNLCEPGPSAQETLGLLELAARVPDHGKIAPWRFVLFEGDNRAEFGKVLAQRFATLWPEAKPDQLSLEQQRLTRAPLVIAVISSPDMLHKVPTWEQELSAGAVCQNLLSGATMLGYGAQWLTEWYAFDNVIDTALGLTEHERIAGYIYIGSFTEPPIERPRPEISELVTTWS